MKYLNKISVMLVASGMLATTSCSDFSDYNTEVSDSNLPSANKTLWENISSREDISKFREILQRVGFDKQLMGSHTYTVWAPVNENLDTAMLNNLSDEKLLNQFVYNHVADYAHREGDVNDSIIYMLNGKLLKFNNKNTGKLLFDGIPVLPNAETGTFTNPSSNGAFYTIESSTGFRYNGYEVLSDLKGTADSLYQYVKDYEIVTLDEKKSVKGLIVDGVQHYDDSVLIVSNELITKRLKASLESEDSSYTVLVPSNQAWKESYETISKYYNYRKDFVWQNLSLCPDVAGGTITSRSVTAMDANIGQEKVEFTAPVADVTAYWTDSITKRYLTDNIIYSNNNLRYNSKLVTDGPFEEKDSVYSTIGKYLTNPKGIIDATQEVIPLSNGEARILSAYPFLPEETYSPVLKSRAHGRTYPADCGKNVKVLSVPMSQLDPEKVQLEDDEKSLTYVQAVVPRGDTRPVELDFYVYDVRSTTYDIYAVMVPACVVDPKAAPKSYSLRFDINYTDASNTQIRGRMDGNDVKTTPNTMKSVKAFITNPEKVDTVKLARITFPMSYVGAKAGDQRVGPNIKIMHTTAIFNDDPDTNQYDNELRVANIIFREVKKED